MKFRNLSILLLLATSLSAQAERERVIVKFAATPSALGANEKAMRSQKIQSMSGGMLHLKQTVNRAEVFELDYGESLPEVLEALREREDVLYAEPDRKLVPFAIASPNDPQFINGEQWYLQGETTGQGNDFLNRVGATDFEGAWGLGATGDGVVVAVVDTGFTIHEDLDNTPSTGNIVVGRDFVGPDPGVDAMFRFSTDSDGEDGRDEDATDPGDFVSRSETLTNPVFPEACESRSGKSSWHGTLVSGVIAAEHDNGRGIAAAAPEAKVLMVRALGKCGGYVSDIMEGALWASGLFTDALSAPSVTADIVNLSLGSEVEGACSAFEQESITAMHDAGIVVVTAAGNGGANGEPLSNVSPGNCNFTINVGANSRQGDITGYSNRGQFVDLTAPGGNTNSLGQPVTGDRIIVTDQAAVSGEIMTASTLYDDTAGTSFSAPIVSATLALMLDVAEDNNIDITPEQLYGTLRASVTEFGESTQCNLQGGCGAGMVNAKRAVQAIIADNVSSESFPTKPVIGQSESSSSESLFSPFYVMWAGLWGWALLRRR